MLQTQSLILREWEDADAEDLYKYASNPLVGPIAGWPEHRSVKESLEVIQNILKAPNTFAVVLKDTNRVVGSIGLMIGKASNIGLPDDEAEIGYWIGVPYWGRGLIPEATKEIIRYAFEELKLKKLWCGYFDGNLQSRRVIEKCGFTYAYTKDDVPCQIKGLLRREHVYCLCNKE